MKIWTCGSSPRSGSRNAWTWNRNVNGASRLSKFWKFLGAIQMISCRAWLVTVDETWLYHYDPETKQHSMKWGHSASPRPKKFRVQKVFVSIFWDRYGILLIDYIPKAQNINAEYYSSLLVQLKEIFKEKRRDSLPRYSCPCTTMSRRIGHLQPRETGQCLDHPPYSTDLARRTTTYSLDWKKQLKGRHFPPTRMSLQPRRPVWMDNNLIFFWVACKSYSNGLRSVLSFVGSVLNISRVCSL